MVKLIFRILTEGEEVQKKSKRQEKVIKELETVAANARVKDWTVSQDDIHFCVSMLDKHEQVSVNRNGSIRTWIALSHVFHSLPNAEVVVKIFRIGKRWQKTEQTIIS